MRTSFYIILTICLLISLSIIKSCTQINKDATTTNKTQTHTPTAAPTATTAAASTPPWTYQGLTEIKRGDIIVKPNMNLLPGTSLVPNGYSFGHAAFVTSGYAHENIDSLLAKIKIIESIAINIPVGYQVREIQGYTKHKSPLYSSESFGPEFSGIRYRLRYNFTETQIDSIIHFLRDQLNDQSNWNAMKRFPESSAKESSTKQSDKNNWADNSHWYCSLLVWQSILYVTGIDLDPNAGYYVYPNDLINSKYFDNTSDMVQRRVRF